MARERWGTYSVKDHTNPYPFASDVLMYDRLVIPRPANDIERMKWVDKWDPDRLDKVLEILGTGDDGHALPVQWGSYTEDLFQERMQTATIVTEEYAYGMTARMLAHEFLPKGPAGSAPVLIVAAYQSKEAAEQEWLPTEPSKESLTLAIAREFVVPDPQGRDELDFLKACVALANDSDFKEKRARLYEWEQTVIDDKLTDRQAVEEMRGHVDKYNQAVRKAKIAVVTKFAFTLIPISLTAAAGPIGAAAGLGAVSSLVKFWLYDRKPVINAKDSDVAAMLHSVHGDLGWRLHPDG